MVALSIILKYSFAIRSICMSKQQEIESIYLEEAIVDNDVL